MSGPSAAVETLLTRLEGNLAEQLALAQAGRFDAFADLTAEVGELLARAVELLPTMCADMRGRLERINSLHRRIGLTLAEQGQEIRRRMDRSVQGRRAVNAYRGT